MTLLFILSPAVTRAWGAQTGGYSVNPSADQLDWPYELTDLHLQALREAGCLFDEEDKNLASRLAARGFTSDQYVKAYQQWSKLGLEERTDVEAVAEFLVLGLPLSEFNAYRGYRARGWTLTQFYNKRIGGRGQVIGGWVATGIGLVDFIVGTVCLLSRESLADAYSYGTLGHDPDYWKTVGTVQMAAGGLVAVIGLAIQVSGRAKVNRWAPLGTLENGDIKKLKQYKIKSSADTSVPFELSLSPIVSGMGGGLKLTVRF